MTGQQRGHFLILHVEITPELNSRSEMHVTPESRKQWLPRLASSEKRAPRKMVQRAQLLTRTCPDELSLATGLEESETDFTLHFCLLVPPSPAIPALTLSQLHTTVLATVRAPRDCPNNCPSFPPLSQPLSKLPFDCVNWMIEMLTLAQDNQNNCDSQIFQLLIRFFFVLWQLS